MSLPRLFAGALAVCCAAITVTAVPAAAAIPSSLILTARASNEPAHVVRLTCDPTGGTHPDAQTTCMQIARVGGDLTKLPAIEEHRFCPMIFAPITVTASGLWRGMPVLFEDNYTNGCVRDNRTGSLFRF
jgi:Subtilisin inhibitor-like